MYAVDVDADRKRPEEVKHQTFVRELQTKSLQGRFAVDFVTRSSIGEWVESNVLAFARSVATLAQENPGIFVRDSVAPGDFGYPDWIQRS
jgi:hypothetical protein